MVRKLTFEGDLLFIDYLQNLSTRENPKNSEFSFTIGDTACNITPEFQHDTVPNHSQGENSSASESLQNQLQRHFDSLNYQARILCVGKKDTNNSQIERRFLDADSTPDSESEKAEVDSSQYLKIGGVIVLGLSIFATVFLLMHLLIGCRNSKVDAKQQLQKFLKEYLTKFTTQVWAKDAEKAFHQTEWAICLEGFDEEAQIREINICKHSFHSKCLEEYFKIK